MKKEKRLYRKAGVQVSSMGKATASKIKKSFAVATNVCGDPWILMDGGEYDLERAIADAVELASDFNDETKSKARMYLYRFLMNNPDVLASDPVFEDFMETYESTVLSGIFEVDEGLRNVEQYDSTFMTLLQTTDSLILVVSDSIGFIYLNELEEEYAETLEYLYDQLDLMYQSLNNLYIQHQAYVDGELDSLNLRNEYLISTEIPEQNNINVNDVYINYLQSQEYYFSRNYEVIENEYNSLFAIAMQCPSAGGKAVYRARAMLELINDTIDYNDDMVCLQSGIYREALLENEVSFDFELIPNPTADKTELKLLNPQQGFCTVKLINSIGSVILLEKVNCEEINHTLNLQDKNSGIYFVEVEFNNFRKVKKLVVIK